MRLPDGPSGPPWLRRLRFINWILRPFEVMEARAKKYGDIFAIAKNASPSMVYLSNPAAIEQVLGANPEFFDTNSGNDVLLPLLGANSLILLGGMKHQRQRKLLMPPFHGDRLRTYGQTIWDITTQVTSQWQVGQSITVRAATQEISMRVILSAVFGLDGGERYDRLRKLLTSLLETVSSPVSSMVLFFPSLQKDWGKWSPWGLFLQMKQQIDDLLVAEIQQRRAEMLQRVVETLHVTSPPRDDILSLLLAARDEAGQPMTDEELRDELLTLLFAGHETTASALAWALYWLDRLPEVKEKLQAEIDSLGDNPDPSAIAKLPYLNAVCCETLRIYPIAISPFPRILKVPMEIGGYQLESGAIVVISIYLTHQREDLYPQPKQFIPERFLERQFSPYEYLPFGGSNRRCIGAAFALFEMKLVLANILSNYDLKLASNRPVKPTRRGLTVAPPANMKMIVEQKSKVESQNSKVLLTSDR
ncbi:cytochrome P450 [Chroococcidiopsidales cyanobacterium LEGE 13417]|nr:cytochrome P450 [Chroococcidiopsidales cyanobacterium LEGE 13417]